MVNYHTDHPGKIMRGLAACIECDNREFYAARIWEERGDAITPIKCTECGEEYQIQGRHPPY